MKFTTADIVKLIVDDFGGVSVDVEKRKTLLMSVITRTQFRECYKAMPVIYIFGIFG